MLHNLGIILIEDDVVRGTIATSHDGSGRILHAYETNATHQVAHFLLVCNLTTKSLN